MRSAGPEGHLPSSRAPIHVSQLRGTAARFVGADGNDTASAAFAEEAYSAGAASLNEIEAPREEKADFPIADPFGMTTGWIGCRGGEQDSARVTRGRHRRCRGGLGRCSRLRARRGQSMRRFRRRGRRMGVDSADGCRVWSIRRGKFYGRGTSEKKKQFLTCADSVGDSFSEAIETGRSPVAGCGRD